jgi:methyl-accepting chemotaxis protein
MDMLVRSSQKMAENNEIVNKMIANFAASNEESMSSVKDVTAVSIQQSASSQQVATLSDELSSIAFQLKQSVAAFVIK